MTILVRIGRAIARFGRFSGSVLAIHGADRAGPRGAIANSTRAQFSPEEFAVREHEAQPSDET